MLAGMMVAMTANALGAALILANGEYLFSLFIWGGGSLVQQGWQPTVSIGLRLLLGLASAGLLLRPLAILGLDDQSARNLGVAVHTSRFLIIVLAVWIATTVAAEVGVIGFIGLAAPALATLSGARSLRQKLVATPLIGAVLLWLTDGLVQFFSGPGGERVPTGAATRCWAGRCFVAAAAPQYVLKAIRGGTVGPGRGREACSRGGLVVAGRWRGRRGIAGRRRPAGWQIASGQAQPTCRLRAPRIA